MIDIHLVDDRHVELVEDQALRDMPGQIGMAFDVWHFPRSPAFVGRSVAFAAADCECGNDLHVEGGCVVVIDQHDHVGEVLGDPFARPFVPREDRREILVAHLALIGGDAEQRDMAGRYPCGNPCHQRLSLIERTPSGERPPLFIMSR